MAHSDLGTQQIAEHSALDVAGFPVLLGDGYDRTIVFQQFCPGLPRAFEFGHVPFFIPNLAELANSPVEVLSRESGRVALAKLRRPLFQHLDHRLPSLMLLDEAHGGERCLGVHGRKDALSRGGETKADPGSAHRSGPGPRVLPGPRLLVA